ncbi:hypothetical protein FGAF163_110 (plasmid) [Escherichia coli]|nr:hypothetical protein FGAF163_110 [Escherichia coli]
MNGRAGRNLEVILNYPGYGRVCRSRAPDKGNEFSVCCN